MRNNGRLSSRAIYQIVIQSLFLYLMLYVTADVIHHRTPTLLSHAVTWCVIALGAGAVWIAQQIRTRR